MKRCLILTGGKLDTDFARSFLEKEHFQKIIAVDGGLKAARELQIMPDVAVGDFDTAEPALLAFFRKQEHIIWDVHNPKKDDTDTELAIRRAIAMGCDETVLLGATGGRLDHLLGNIHLLFPCLQTGMNACIIDPQNKLYLIDTEHTFKRGELWGKYISFLPLTEEVKGITLTGFRYPLTDTDIQIGTSLCISNEVEEEEAKIAFEDGVLIVVESHD
jgi:thiamine pyrophosphokinase